MLATSLSLQTSETRGCTEVTYDGNPQAESSKSDMQKQFQVWRLVRGIKEETGADTKKVDVYTYTQGWRISAARDHEGSRVAQGL